MGAIMLAMSLQYPRDSGESSHFQDQIPFHMEFAAAATNPVPAIIHISRSSPRPAMPLLGAGVTEAVGTEATPGRVVAVDFVLVEPDFDA
jgi:hypothetical protein